MANVHSAVTACHSGTGPAAGTAGPPGRGPDGSWVLHLQRLLTLDETQTFSTQAKGKLHGSVSWCLGESH